MSDRAARLVAAGAVVVVAVAVPVAALTHKASDQSPTIRVAPLSATDREALLASHDLIVSLPKAFSEIPWAVSDASGVRPAVARTELAGSAALRPMVPAIDGRSTALTALVSAYRALLERRAPADAAGLSGALEALQAAEGDVVPAVRAVAQQHGRQLSVSDALMAVERDASTPELGRLLANWSQVYGVFVLVEQAAAR